MNNKQPKTAKKLTLALGESTHTHILECEKDVEYSISEVDNQIIDFKLAAEGVITHEQHDTVKLDSGDYLKIPQVEYDPFTDRVHNVFD